MYVRHTIFSYLLQTIASLYISFPYLATSHHLISHLSTDKPVNTTITTNIAQNTATQGQNVTFTCDVTDANPPVSEYRFYFNDSNKAMKTLQNTSKFTIYDAQRARNFGKYKCVAQNDAGDDHSDPVFLNINGK